MSTEKPVTTVGASVTYVDETGHTTPALVTAVHGIFHVGPEWTKEEAEAYFGQFTSMDDETRQQKVADMVGTPCPQMVPCINVVYVSLDRSKRDPYGSQVERASSVQHKNQTTAHGRYWC